MGHLLPFIEVDGEERGWVYFFWFLMFSNYKASVSVIAAEEGVTYVSFSEATATAPSSPSTPETRTYGRTMEAFSMLDV